MMNYNDLERRCQRMVAQFAALGLKLVVFMDANIARNKLETWLRRRASRCDSVFGLNAALRRNAGRCPPSDRLWFPDNGCYFMVGQMWRRCGCSVYYAQTDCDREMVGYYKVHRGSVLALCSADSDFFIFDVPLYLEMDSIEFGRGRLRMRGYRHRRVLALFGLKQRRLPHLAAIMGCDVVERSPSTMAMIHRLYRSRKGGDRGAVHLIARFLRDSERNENGHGGGRRQIGCGPKLRRKFKICADFYSPVFPLGLLDHPYLIQLLFGDRCQESTDSDGGGGGGQRCRDGVILDLCRDDVSLRAPAECSAVAVGPLRGCLYSAVDGDGGGGSQWKEVVCWPIRKLQSAPSSLVREWRRGRIVAAVHRDENPLYRLQSYRFVAALQDEDGEALNGQRRRVPIPPRFIFEDVLCLLKWLRTRCADESAPTAPLESGGNEPRPRCGAAGAVAAGRADGGVDAVDVAPRSLGPRPLVSDDAVSKTAGAAHSVAADERKWKSSKRTKQRRRRKRQEMRRQDALAMLYDRSVCGPKQRRNEPSKAKGPRSAAPSTSRDGLWTHFGAIEEALTMQWEHRHLFVDGARRSDHEYRTFRRAAFAKQPRGRMSCIAMHFQSVFFGVYEVLFAFLRLQSDAKWFGALYRGRKEGAVPPLELEDEAVDARCAELNEWRLDLQAKAAANVDIPCCWDIVDVELFHWMVLHMDTAKQWITECSK